MNRYYIKYFMYLILSLIVTFVGALLSPLLSTVKVVILIAASLILMLAFLFSEGVIKKILFFIFNFTEGMLIAQIILKSTTINMSIILSAIGITIAMVVIFMIIGLLTKDLSGLGSTLFACLIVVLILSLISMFVNMPFLAYVIVLLFCGYVAYDFNKFKNEIKKNRTIDDDNILNHVMDMYLDIINIFVQILDILSDD